MVVPYNFKNTYLPNSAEILKIHSLITIDNAEKIKKKSMLMGCYKTKPLVVFRGTCKCIELRETIKYNRRVDIHFQEIARYDEKL